MARVTVMTRSVRSGGWSTASAAKLADYLAGHKKIKRLVYPGRADHPQADIVKKLNAALVKSLAEPDIRDKLGKIAQDIFPTEQLTPSALGIYHKAEIDKWWPIMKEAGIKLPRSLIASGNYTFETGVAAASRRDSSRF